jgi:hypothetical protein
MKEANENGVLNEDMVFSKTRTTSLKEITQFNAWGCELRDVSIVSKMSSLQILSLSVNYITSLRPFSGLKELKELYVRANRVGEADHPASLSSGAVLERELRYLSQCKQLTTLWLAENPCVEAMDYHLYRHTVARILPQVTTLDSKGTFLRDEHSSIRCLQNQVLMNYWGRWIVDVSESERNGTNQGELRSQVSTPSASPALHVYTTAGTGVPSPSSSGPGSPIRKDKLIYLGSNHNTHTYAVENPTSPRASRRNSRSGSHSPTKSRSRSAERTRFPTSQGPRIKVPDTLSSMLSPIPSSPNFAGQVSRAVNITSGTRAPPPSATLAPTTNGNVLYAVLALINDLDVGGLRMVHHETLRLMERAQDRK